MEFINHSLYKNRPRNAIAMLLYQDQKGFPTPTKKNKTSLTLQKGFT